jgi:hypothetical protein
MPYFIDLGAGPAEEDCAQLGQSPDFDTLNRLEIAVYKSDYATRVEEGLATWREAGFTAPVEYNGETPSIVHADPADAVISALLITRPGLNGVFPIPDFAVLHGNLTQAYPAEAAVAQARLAEAADA